MQLPSAYAGSVACRLAAQEGHGPVSRQLRASAQRAGASRPTRKASKVAGEYVRHLNSEGGGIAVSDAPTGSFRVLDMRRSRDDAQIICAHAHRVAGMELSATPQLGLTVDDDLTAGNQGLGIRSARGSTGKLQ